MPISDSTSALDDTVPDDGLLFECLGEFTDLAAAGRAPKVEDYRARLGDQFPRFHSLIQMEGMLDASVEPSAEVPLPTLIIDRYRDFRPVGEGGMGIVYWAIDDILNREVALKVVKPHIPGGDMASPDAPNEVASPAQGTPASQGFEVLRRRFLQEAWVTSGMTHPGIVPVYELGETIHGVPYYTMRFVRGERTLARAIEELDGASIDERLALLDPFLKICDTIRYAHAQGVVHRDLKPANVALGEFGEVIVLDWGLARLDADQDLHMDVWQERLNAYRSSSDLRTIASALGTPGYMSPEAAKGHVAVLDERSDVYSLGVILFEILTGRLPFTFATYDEFLQKLLTFDAPRADDLDAAIPAALVDVCQHALQREQDARLGSVRELSAAIRNWQTQSAAEREAARLIDEARVHLAAAEELKGVGFLRQVDRAAAVVAQVLTQQPKHAEALGLEARIAEARRRGIKQREQHARRRLLRIGSIAGVVLLAVLGMVFVQWNAERERARESLWQSHLSDARAKRRSGVVGQRVATLEALRAAAALRIDSRLRHEVAACVPLTDLVLETTWPHEHAELLAVDPAFQRYAVATSSGDLLVCDMATGKQLARLPSPGGHPYWRLWFHPHGKHVAAKYSAPDMAEAPLTVWDIDAGKIVLTTQASFWKVSMDFHPAGDRLALGLRDETVQILAFPSGEILADPSPGVLPEDVRFSHGGAHLAVAGNAPEFVVLDLQQDGKVVAKFTSHHGIGAGTSRVAWSPDDGAIAVGCNNRAIYVFDWKRTNYGPRSTIRGHANDGIQLWWQADASHLISTAWDGTLRMWDPDTGASRLVVNRSVRDVHVSSDGARIAGLTPKGVQIWKIVKPQAWRRIPIEQAEVAGFDFTPDSRWLVMVEETAGLLRIADVDGARPLAFEQAEVLKGLPHVTFFGWDLLLAGNAGWHGRSVRDEQGLAKLASSRPPHAPPGPTSRAPSTSLDGRWMAIVLDDGSALVRPLDGSAPARRFEHGRLSTAVVSDGGRYLAASHWRLDVVHIWDVRSGRLLRKVKGTRFQRSVFDRGGRHVVISDLGGLTTYQVSPWKQVAHHATANRPIDVVMHAREDLLAFVEPSGQVTLLRPATLEVLLRLMPPYAVNGRLLRFSPDGRRLAVSRPAEHGVEVWDLATIRERLRSLGLDWDK